MPRMARLKAEGIVDVEGNSVDDTIKKAANKKSHKQRRHVGKKKPLSGSGPGPAVEGAALRIDEWHISARSEAGQAIQVRSR